jgi:hypothetical protein
MTTKKAAGKSNGSGLKASINATTKDTTIESKSITQPEGSGLPPLTPVERKIIRQRLRLFPDEAEVLLNGLPVIHNKSILWYKEENEEKGCFDTYPVCLNIHSFKSTRWDSDRDHLNNQSFFVHCEYDGRLWRCKDFQAVAKLIKALRKDLKIRYDYMNWTR